MNTEQAAKFLAAIKDVEAELRGCETRLTDIRRRLHAALVGPLSRIGDDGKRRGSDEPRS